MFYYLIISLFYCFSPSKIGGFERGRIEDSLDLSVRILGELLTRSEKYLDVLVKIFSSNRTYYTGNLLLSLLLLLLLLTHL